MKGQNNESRFGLKTPVADLDRLKGSWTFLYTTYGNLYAKIGESDGANVVLTNSLVQIPGPEGVLLRVFDKPNTLAKSTIHGFREASYEEIKCAIEHTNQYQRYLSEPVKVRDGGGDHFGFVCDISYNEILLRPSLVLYPGEYGVRYRIERKIPELVKNPIIVTPLRENDLEQIVKNSEAEYELARRRKLLEEKQLALHEKKLSKKKGKIVI